ncbi:hypothetical protein J4433_02900 [Candidatus Pacearchaeota archaeon]|nr:hypothetical protein [Candidatus Pacearchaeota archaeon]
MGKITKLLQRKKAMIEGQVLIDWLLWIAFLALIGWGIIYLLKKFT